MAQKYKRTQRKFAPQIVETKDFSGRVVLDVDGKNKIEMLSPIWYRHQIQKLKVGEVVSIYISSKRPKRTIQQNRYWWLYMTIIAKETGHTPEEIHEWAKGKFLTIGIKKVFGNDVRIKGSTTDLSKQDFGELIDKVGAETGIQSPPVDYNN